MEENITGAVIMDPFSQLPEPLLQRVLSFLGVTEAIRKSLVSKRWNNACIALPFLNIDRGFFSLKGENMALLL